MAPISEARLISIAGPLEGRAFALDAGEFSIGREPTNRLALDDPHVSRRHCLIRRNGVNYSITDLASSNGTFVNGVPVQQRELQHGDQVGIGVSAFLVLLQTEEPPSMPPVLVDEGLSGEATLRLKIDDLPFFQPQTPVASSAIAQRSARDLETLLRISAEISSVNSIEPLQRRLLELIFEVVPADRGAILRIGSTPDDYRSIFGWDRVPALDRPLHVSRAAIERALDTRAPVMVNVASEAGGATAGGGSVEPRSILCVPLLLGSKAVGAIYLDVSGSQSKFDEHHLVMMSAIASMAASALETAGRVELLENETSRLQAEIDLAHDMVGESRAMREVYRFIAKVATTDATVLIGGESGTGKELVARAVHRSSRRATKPFVPINCAALTETLLESELFGHERGAFTGAVTQKKGRLEVAEGGTVFLDEIGELALPLQTKVLRALQERQFERVGGLRPIKVDIRLIAATNRNLEEEVKRGTFRRDLYYRLNVVSLTLPPLRDRREDISLLATYFASQQARKLKRPVIGISQEARLCLMHYDWPGNIRELENAIERAVVLGSTETILPEDLPDSVVEAQTSPNVILASYHQGVREAKKQLIMRAMEQGGGNYTEASRLLGIRPTYLHRLMRNLGLKEVKGV